MRFAIHSSSRPRLTDGAMFQRRNGSTGSACSSLTDRRGSTFRRWLPYPEPIGRLVTIGLWTPVAIAFHAIGFNPALYRELRAALDELLGEDDHPLLRVVPSKFGPRCTVLRALDWAEWPRMVEDGMPALEATRRILETRA